MSNNIKVGFSATDAGYTSTIKKINESTKSLDDNVKKTSRNVSSSFASMVKAGAGLAVGFGVIKGAGELVSKVFDGFSQALDLGGKLSDLSTRTGETAGNLMLLQRAFDNAGSSADAVGPAINKLQKFMVDAANGSEKNTEALARLGLEFTDLEGKAPIEQMRILADRIKAIPDPADRSAAAMGIFGKSGGALLPVLMDLSGGLETAKNQLGSLPDVMTRSKDAFDAIGDNITVIKGKFMEFAAGFLDRIAPAIELATTLLTRFDAAALGMKLGDVITGASKAMGGFSDALNALQLGEFELAFKIAFDSIKLQAADSINSIYANIRGLMAAIGTMIEGSGITIILDSLVMGITNKISSGIRSVLSDFLNSIGKFEAAKEMALLSKSDEERANNYFQIANAGFQSLGENIKNSMDPMKKAYDDAVSSSSKLIDTTEIQINLEKSRLELEKARANEAQKSGMAAETFDTKRKASQEAYIKTLEIIKGIEEQIKKAKSIGDDEQVKALQKKLKFEQDIASALKEGKTLQEAITFATENQNKRLENNLQTHRDITSEMGKQLSLSQRMGADIADKRKEESRDPGGKIEQKFQEALNKGDFSGAERQKRKMENNEIREDIKDLYNDINDTNSKIGKNSRDLAKELGIDTFRKTKRELDKEIKDELEKRKREKDIERNKKEMKPGGEGEKDKPIPDGEKPKDPPDYSGLIQNILSVVQKIEPKLPQTALGY